MVEVQTPRVTLAAIYTGMKGEIVCYPFALSANDSIVIPLRLLDVVRLVGLIVFSHCLSGAGAALSMANIPSPMPKVEFTKLLALTAS
jgi:hypothetical protein